MSPTSKGGAERRASIDARRAQAQADKRACETLARELCWSRGACERCGNQDNGVQWAHIHPRRYMKIRHDLRNCWALCAGCHQYVDNVSIVAHDLAVATIGEALYRELWRIAQDTRTKADYGAMRAKLEACTIPYFDDDPRAKTV